MMAMSSCADAVPVLGPSPEQARSNASTMLHAVADRFGIVTLAPEVARTRPRLARYSVTPSRIVGDRDMWTSETDSSRTIEIVGARRAGVYTLFHRPGALTPVEPGTTRHVMHLHLLGGDEFRWRSVDELSIGAVQPDELDRALTAMFRAAQAVPAGERPSPARVFPRASASVTRLFVLDSLRTIHDADGATTVRLGIGIRPAAAQRSFSSLGDYVRTYWLPLRWHAVLTDSSGIRWGEFTKRDSSITMRFRVHEGSLAPFGGRVRPADRTMRLAMDASAKVGPFRVGVRGLEAQIIRESRPGAFAVVFRFRDEPEWQLPPLVARLLRAPLRRPFEHGGALLRLGARTSGVPDDAATIVWRDIDITVRESAILRFLGRLGGTALGDFREGAEKEAERLWDETLRGLADDVMALQVQAATR